MQIAILDIGKTNIKLVLIENENFKQIEAISCFNEITDNGQYPCFDVSQIWRFILDGLRRFNRDYVVDAISITTHGATAVLLDDDQLALDVLDYESVLPEQTKAQYAQERGAFSETLSPSLPKGLNLGAQLYWQQRTFPEQFSKVTDIMMYPQYWAWKLTNIKATEITSLGVHTDLWNPTKKRFSNLVYKQKWRKLFPPTRPANSILGNISSEVSEYTEMDENVEVVCGIHDSNASLLPHLKKQNNNFTVVSSGTWTIIMSIGSGIEGLDPVRDSMANVNMFGDAVPTARFMGGREYDFLIGDREAVPTIENANFIIDNQIFILPTFELGVGPFPNSHGMWKGEFENLSDGEFCAAISIYLALMTNACIDIAGLGDYIILEGPLSKNEIYASFLAALTQRKIYLSADMTGTSKGAAMLFNMNSKSDIVMKTAVPFSHEQLAQYQEKWLRQAKNMEKLTV